MKLTIVDNECHIVAENPDDRVKKDFAGRLRAAVLAEIDAFMEEVSVALRKTPPGEKARLESRPIVVTIEREKAPKPTKATVAV